MSEIRLYDTTLRDGAQREGISFAVVDKLHIARKIDELGIQDGDGNSLVSADETNYSMYPEQGRLVGSIQQHLREVPIEKMAVGDILLFKTFRDPQHVGLLTQYQSGGPGWPKPSSRPFR